MKYIDAELLRKEIEFAKSIYNNPKRVVHGVADAFRQDGRAAMCDDILKKIDSLQQEQPDFPTTDEQMKEFLATHPKIKVPEKYKNPDWLFKKQEQPKVDLVAELKYHLATTPKEQLEKEWKELEPWNNIGPTVQEFLYGKQPKVDLEKEIEIFTTQLYHETFGNDQGTLDEFDWEDIATVIEETARHFYELGLRRAAEMYDEIEYNRQRAEEE